MARCSGNHPRVSYLRQCEGASELCEFHLLLWLGEAAAALATEHADFANFRSTTSPSNVPHLKSFFSMPFYTPAS